MSSVAYRTRLEPVLADADEINLGHVALRTGNRGRQHGLGALNRAVVVMCVSAWETYLEQVVEECIELLRPQAPPLGNWPAHRAVVRNQTGRFNNPTLQNTRSLIRDSIGLQDVSENWFWPGTSPERSRERLEEAITLRHQVAHGEMPRPIIHNQQYASRLPDFFRRLGTKTDEGITAYLLADYGVVTGW